ncbi:MAG: hypothetical protein JWQ71_3856 [Pedosphaera sp.]|nr:hypothetical protein [Pedosphaera sp.]
MFLQLSGYLPRNKLNHITKILLGLFGPDYFESHEANSRFT